MNKQFVNLLTKFSLLTAIVLVTTVASAQGQSLAYRIRANIPFDFSIGDKELRSGRYSVGCAGQNSDDAILSLVDADGRSKALWTSSPTLTLQAKDNPTLVFHRYGDQYFLFQVWPAGETTGRQFSKSRREREIERNLVGNSSAGKIVKNLEVETVTIMGVMK